VIDECIHGLELTRCDVCSPKAVPQPEVAMRPAARTPRNARQPAKSARRAGAPAPNSRPILVGEQRLHHVTHLSNLEGILAGGRLRSDLGGANPSVDASSLSNREVRRQVPLGAATVADYVPFYLSPDALLWAAIRGESSDPRLSPAVHALPASEFVVLVSTVNAVAAGRDDQATLADGDAADPRTRFADTREDYERVLRRLAADPDTDGLLRAEFLVADAVPFETIALIGVANDKTRDAVRAMFDSTGHKPRVAVHPPWFTEPVEA
jgi:hypothetical protein